MGRRGRCGVALSLALAALSSTHAAIAQPRIVASGDCFDGAAVLELQRDLGALLNETDVSLRVVEVDGRIEINVVSGEQALGERSIETGNASCAEIVQATTLALGLALDDIAIARAEAASTAAPAAVVAPPRDALVLAPVPSPPRDSAQAFDRSPRALQMGLSAEMGLGVAFTAYTSMVATLAADVAYAPGESWSPEVSGRAGVLASFPSRVAIDEIDVWPAGYGARLDGCGGLRARAARLRACGSVVAGALTGDGIETDTLVALGARLEATWRASPRVGLFLAVDALSVVRPLWVRTQPGDFLAIGAQETSEIAAFLEWKQFRLAVIVPDWTESTQWTESKEDYGIPDRQARSECSEVFCRAGQSRLVDDGRRSASELFKAWAGFVARILARTGVPDSDLDDAVQEVFLVAHRRGGFVPCGASEKTWLAEIALRVASNVRRSRRRRPTVHDDVAMGRLESGAPDPHVSTELRERLARVGEALETIPPEPRLVFVLIELSGMSAEEVANERGVPIGTVYSRLHAAKKAFRASYERGLARAPQRSLLSSLRARISLSLASATPKKELAR